MCIHVHKGFCQGLTIGLDITGAFSQFARVAGVVELVDTGDLKSRVAFAFSADF